MNLNPFDKRTPEEKAADEARKAKDKAYEEAWKAEESARKAAEKIREKKQQRIANRSCPLLVFYSVYETHQYNNIKPSEQEYGVDAEFKKFRCMELDCLWWSQSGKECYILLACKKMLDENVIQKE